MISEEPTKEESNKKSNKKSNIEARRKERDDALIGINEKPLSEQKKIYMEYLDTYDERSKEAIKRRFNHLQ